MLSSSRGESIDHGLIHCNRRLRLKLLYNLIYFLFCRCCCWKPNKLSANITQTWKTPSYYCTSGGVWVPGVEQFFSEIWPKRRRRRKHAVASSRLIVRTQHSLIADYDLWCFAQLPTANFPPSFLVRKVWKMERKIWLNSSSSPLFSLSTHHFSWLTHSNLFSLYCVQRLTIFHNWCT